MTRFTALERDLQVSVCELLALHERMGRLAYFAVPNGGWRNLKEAVNLRTQGVRAGVPDMVVLFPGARAQFWELKRPGSKGELKRSQAAWQKALTDMGFFHHVIRSITDVENVLKQAFA